MASDSQKIQLLVDSIHYWMSGERKMPDCLKLVYNSQVDGHSDCSLLNKCGMVHPTVTILSYDNCTAGYLGFFMSKSWSTKRDKDRFSGSGWRGFSRKINDDEAFLFYDFPEHNARGTCNAKSGGTHFGIDPRSGACIMYIGQKAEITLFKNPPYSNMAEMTFKNAAILQNFLHDRKSSKAEVYQVTMDLSKYQYDSDASSVY